MKLQKDMLVPVWRTPRPGERDEIDFEGVSRLERRHSVGDGRETWWVSFDGLPGEFLRTIVFSNYGRNER